MLSTILTKFTLDPQILYVCDSCKFALLSAYPNFPYRSAIICLVFFGVWLFFAAAAAKSLQSCLTLCDPIDEGPPGSPVPGILQARTLEWVAISFSNAWKWKWKEVAQSCPTLSNPMDYSLPGSAIHGIFQARVLEWGAIAFLVGAFNPFKFKVIIEKYDTGTIYFVALCSSLYTLSVFPV